MPQEGIITAPSYVPPAVMDYLSSPGITKENFTIKNKYQLNQKDIDFIFDIYWDIIEKKRAPNALAVELRDYFKRWPADKVNTLALAILGKQLAPLSNMISGIEQEIKDLGGKIEDYPKKKVVPQAVSVQELTDNLISDLRVVLPDKFLKHRLENIVISKIKGVRDDFEIKNHLIRGVKIGGLDIAPSLADQIIKYIDSVQGLVKIVEQTSRPSQPSITPQAPGATKVLAPKSEPEISEAVLKKETGRGQAFTVRPEDIDEIIREREKIIPSPVLGEFARLEKEIMQQSGLAFSDPNAQARLQSAIRARLRDVRDELETKNFLTRGPREGGLGLPKEKADALAELIDKMSQPLRERLVKMEKEKETEQIKKTERGKREEQDKEHQELDKRFAALTGRTPSPLPREKEEKSSAPLSLEEEKNIPSFRKEHLAKEAQAKQAPKLLAAPKSASAPGQVVPQEKIHIAHPAQSRPAPQPAPMPSRPKPKVRISPQSTPAGKPKMEEIKFSKQLVGPIEELRQMKMEDFRRLSRDAKEASLKIKDKIELLEEESFDKKIKAISAWQESPVNQFYLNLIQEAFQGGKNIQTIVSDRQRQGRKTLTWDEFQAILELNQGLKV